MIWKFSSPRPSVWAGRQWWVHGAAPILCCQTGMPTPHPKAAAAARHNSDSCEPMALCWGLAGPFPLNSVTSLLSSQ